MSDITIRNATLADTPRILEIYAYYVEHTVITFEYDVPSLAEFEDRMRAIMQKYPYLVIEPGWPHRGLRLCPRLCGTCRLRLGRRADHLSRPRRQARRTGPRPL